MQRTESHFNVAVDREEMLDRRSLIVLCYLEALCDGGALYNNAELLELLSGGGCNERLGLLGYKPLRTLGTGGHTSVQFVLNNLYRNNLIRKVATGSFGMSGRPIGVMWEISNARQNLQVRHRV